MKLLWSYVRNYKKILFLALILAAINQVFSLLDPQIFRIIIDRYATKASEIPRSEFLNGVGLLLLASVGVAFISRVAKNFQDYFVNIITQRVGAQLYENSIKHSFSLPFMAFEDKRSGELLQKLQKARTDSQQFISSSINVLFLALVGIVFVIIYAFRVNPLIGVVYFLMIPALGAVMFFLTRRIKAAQKEIVAQTATLAGSTTETLRNVELVKSLGLENQETERLNANNKTILELELKKIKLIRVLSFIQGSLINGIRSALLFLMMWLIFSRGITFGEFMSLYIYSFFVFAPLQELGNLSNQYQEASASMEKLGEILNEKPEEKPIDAKDPGQLQGIRFNDVSFVYQNRELPAVKNITLEIKPGQTVAFVGPSGAGKSTLAKILVGLYHPSGGAMLINDIDSSRLDFDSFRKRIGYVSQDTQLFAGTIRENLLFVKPNATDQECFEALKQSAAMPILERSNEGLNTKIGEGGLKLSGGERQRLAIARALLRSPDLIVFDEATSSLDSITEKEITDTIKRISEVRPSLTTVLIAHRLSTIVHSNRIYVLENGILAESGDHAGLVASGGLYAALWREQGMPASIKS
jgi:ATP-binding cassette, subfamily B, bacterial